MWSFDACRRQPQTDVKKCVTARSAASPGESSHMVSLLLGGLDEAQKLELRHSLDETGTAKRAEEHFFNSGLYLNASGMKT